MTQWQRSLNKDKVCQSQPGPQDSWSLTMEQRTLKNVNNYLNTNIYSYIETSGG